MKRARDIEKLRKAVELITDVQLGLDNGSDACPGCGGTRYHNWTEHGSHEALGGAKSRLDKVIRWLENEGSR